MIVIFAPADDRHALRVADILQRSHGEDSLIFDMSTFPLQSTLAASFGSDDTYCRFTDHSGQVRDFFDVKSFWWRRPQSPTCDPRITDPKVQNFAMNESLSALYGVLGCCNALWMNNINNDQRADYKPTQLAMARACGFQVPETMITNSSDAVMEFYHRNGGDIVYKSFNQRGIIWQPTRKMNAEDLTHLSALVCAPVIFQRHIAGTRDIRVTVVGDTVFATEFDISGMNLTDHRLALDAAACRPHTLPPEIAQKILTFMRAFGLEYGCVDFRIGDDGQYHFFEINTAGEFLYIQDRSGQQIDAAVAAHLARGVASGAQLGHAGGVAA